MIATCLWLIALLVCLALAGLGGYRIVAAAGRGSISFGRGVAMLTAVMLIFVVVAFCVVVGLAGGFA